jgi:MarR family transcriptional regulator, 2-MHQ and catechol-resistance regulon repressor
MADSVDLKQERTALDNLFSLVRTWQVLERYLDLELQKSDSSLIRFAVMSALYKNGGRSTPSELAAETFRSKNTITSVLDALEKEDFVKRIPSVNDGRSFNVVVTDKGRKISDTVMPTANDISREIFSCFNDSEITELLTMLGVFRDNLVKKIGSA